MQKNKKRNKQTTTAEWSIGGVFLLIFTIISLSFTTWIVGNMLYENMVEWSDSYIEEKKEDDDWIKGRAEGDESQTFYCMIANFFSDMDLDKEIMNQYYSNLSTSNIIVPEVDFTYDSMIINESDPFELTESEELHLEGEATTRKISDELSPNLTCDNYEQKGEDGVISKDTFIYSIFDWLCNPIPFEGETTTLIERLPSYTMDIQLDMGACTGILVDSTQVDDYLEKGWIISHEVELQSTATDKFQKDYELNDSNPLFFDATTPDYDIINKLEQEGYNIRIEEHSIQHTNLYQCVNEDGTISEDYNIYKNYQVNYKTAFLEEISYMGDMNFSLIDDDNYLEEGKSSMFRFLYEDDKSVLQKFEEGFNIDYLDEELQHYIFDTNFDYDAWRNSEYMPKYMLFVMEPANETFYFSSADTKKETEIEKEYTIDFSFSNYNIKYDYINAPIETLDYHYNYRDEAQFLIDLMESNDYDEVHDLSNVREEGLFRYHFELKRNNHSTYIAKNVDSNIDSLDENLDIENLYLTVELASGEIIDLSKTIYWNEELGDWDIFLD